MSASLRAVACIAVVNAVSWHITPATSPARPALSILPERPETRLKTIQSEGAKLLVRDVSSTGSGPVALDVRLNGKDVGGYSFLMFRGVPETFNFSSGFRVKKSWVVSLRSIDGLKLVPPTGYVGQIELNVLLVQGRDETVESHKMLVSFGVADEPVSASSDTQPSSNELLTSALPKPTPRENKQIAPSSIAEQELGLRIPSELQLSKGQERKLLDRAAGLVEIGEISSARLMFEHLAKQGSGLGALALAQTYDPVYFRAMKTLGGPRADIEKARMWYHIAAELGQDEAYKLLSALSDK